MSVILSPHRREAYYRRQILPVISCCVRTAGTLSLREGFDPDNIQGISAAHLAPLCTPKEDHYRHLELLSWLIAAACNDLSPPRHPECDRRRTAPTTRLKLAQCLTILISSGSLR